MQIQFMRAVGHNPPVGAELLRTLGVGSRRAAGERGAKPSRVKWHTCDRLEDLVALTVLEHAVVTRQEQRGIAFARHEDEERLAERRNRLEPRGRGRREPGEQPPAQAVSANRPAHAISY